MWKIRFMIQEFFRSFQKNLFKNILLMIMFSISLLMSVVMCSYYFDLGDRYAEATQQDGDSIWCSLDAVLEDGREVENSLATIAGCQNMIDYYETLRSSEDCPILSVDTQSSVYMREEDVDQLFGKKSYEGFQTDWQREAITADFGEDEFCSMLNMKSSQVDLDAYRFFGLRTQEGEGFTEQNMVLRHMSDAVPILLGSDYKGVIPIGEVVDIRFWQHVYPCRVTGILEQGASLPAYGRLDADLCPLDSHILFPFGIKVSDTPDTVEEIGKYAHLDYIALQNGLAQVRDGKIREQVEVFQETGREFGLPAMTIVGTSMGVSLLRRESAASIRILLVLTISLFCFSLYCFFVVFYDKVQANSRIYGIYLMNGCSFSMVLLPLLSEIAVVLMPAVILSHLVFTGENMMQYHVGVIMRTVFLFIGAVFIAGTGFIVFLMKRIDTEKLVRQSDDRRWQHIK